jgi:hypothetical protein
MLVICISWLKNAAIICLIKDFTYLKQNYYENSIFLLYPLFYSFPLYFNYLVVLP